MPPGPTVALRVDPEYQSRVFADRHRVLLILLWAQVPLQAVVGLASGADVANVIVASLALFTVALCATVFRGQMVAATVVTVGLSTAAIVFVGYTEDTTGSLLALAVALVAVSLYRRVTLLVLGFASMAALIGFGGLVDSGASIAVGPASWILPAAGLAIGILLVASWRLGEGANQGRVSLEDGIRLSFEKAPMAMAVLTPSGGMIAANERLVDMLGHESVDGLNIIGLIHPDDHDELGLAWENMGTSEDQSALAWLRCLTSSGQTLWCRVSLHLVPWSAGRPAVVILQADEATRTRDEVTRLERLVRERDEFVAAVGDELRAPLGSVLDLTALADGVNPDWEGMIKDIDARAKEMALVVDDLIISARAESRPRRVIARSHDVSNLVRTALRGIPGSDDIPLVIEASTVWSDATMTRQIISDLVNHSVKFGGSNVVVRAQSSGPDTLIQVIDDGAEIPASERQRIFSGDLRSGKPVTQPATVGLGLTVARYLAQAMDGDVEYRRTEAGQNILELRLPAQEINLEEPAEAVTVDPVGA